VPPLCIFHTDPPPTFSSLDDSGTDAANDAPTSDGSADAGPPDVQSPDVGSSVDAMPDIIVVDTSQPPVDASSDPAVDPTSGDAVSERRDGAAEGGDGAIPTSITVLSSPFLGPYLADSAGRTLYTFGNDQAGDCKNPPVPDCEADCAIAWPPFDAGKRTLPPSLNPMAFGSVVRPDGVTNITSYYGWPLYYYRSDTMGGQINGHGKSKTWHVATVTPANMMIMRAKTNPRYVADGNGFTLYIYEQDTAGTATTDPKSACVGPCTTEHPPFLKNRINAVSSLDPNLTDLGLFVRPDTGQQQVAYKGMPLYLSSADMRSGEQNGLTTGWTIALAP
jgi:predicted lipoprotein with Yx(FWY)xxD motif